MEAQISAAQPQAASPVTEASMSERKNPLARRAMLGGVATAGAAAVVAWQVPARLQAPPVVAQGAVDPAETAQGYQLTDHVKSYYAKARI
jgi:hypothetical protein